MKVLPYSPKEGVKTQKLILEELKAIRKLLEEK